MSLRLFAALALPDDIANGLMALMKGVPGANWRPRENLHLTLRFFGEVSEPIADELDVALHEIASRSASFDLKLKAAGAFGKDHPHTLWAGVEASSALRKLAADCERVARRVGLKAETRKFSPHVTLAFVGASEFTGVQSFVQRHGLFASPAFRIESLGLHSSWMRKSAPSLYRLEADYPLSG